MLLAELLQEHRPDDRNRLIELADALDASWISLPRSRTSQWLLLVCDCNHEEVRRDGCARFAASGMAWRTASTISSIRFHSAGLKLPGRLGSIVSLTSGPISRAQVAKKTAGCLSAVYRR